MNQNVLRKLCIGVVVLLSAFGAFAKDHKPQPFLADSTLTRAGGEEVSHGKLYMAWPKVRMDMKDVQTGFTAFLIIDYVAQTAITLSPQYQTYMEIRLDQKGQAAKSGFPLRPNFDASNPCAHTSWRCKKLAPERIAGRSCVVWEIVSDEYGSITTWIDTKLNFPIKTKNADGYLLEYTNIQEGGQPAPGLFQIPPGYKKSATPSESTPGH